MDDRATAARLCRAFARYQDELLGMLAAILGSPEEARAALQEALLKCWRRRQYLVEIEDLRAWVFRMTLHAGRDLRGRAAPRAPGAESRGRPGDLRRAIAALPPEIQEVFLLRQSGGMSYGEIGRTLNLPECTVKARMRLALEQLAPALPGGD